MIKVSKEKAFDMLSERIVNMNIPDIIYSTKDVTKGMVALLSEIDAVTTLLREIVDKEDSHSGIGEFYNN